jgi:hypothetical protein
MMVMAPKSALSVENYKVKDEQDAMQPGSAKFTLARSLSSAFSSHPLFLRKV